MSAELTTDQGYASACEEARAALVNHPVYHQVNTRSRLATFMQHHVFAVWDFMSLLKRLETDLTRRSLPWTPGDNAWLSGFVYEIVRSEECDELPDGRIMSHFEAYRESMRLLEVDTSGIDALLYGVAMGSPIVEALQDARIPSAAARFTRESLDIAQNGTTAEVAAAFFFGREDIIPDMFMPLLKCIEDVPEASLLRWYFQRHIELDSGPHANIAKRVLDALTQGDETAERLATAARDRAISARHRLWDDVMRSLETSAS